MKNPLTLAGIEPATFRFVAQHLNHCGTAVPCIILYMAIKSILSCSWARHLYRIARFLPPLYPVNPAVLKNTLYTYSQEVFKWCVNVLLGKYEHRPIYCSTLIFTHHTSYKWDRRTATPQSTLFIYYYYLAGCTTFLHLPAPIWQLIIFFHLSLSFQSSSINPVSPISPLIPSAQVSLGLPRFLLPGGLHFITFFWQSPLFHSLNMSIPFKLFSLNIF